jgi:uncharacterized protein
MLLRDARETDFADALRLNAESVYFLSPLDLRRLTWLHGKAVYHRVLEWRGRFEAFLLGFSEVGSRIVGASRKQVSLQVMEAPC